MGIEINPKLALTEVSRQTNKPQKSARTTNQVAKAPADSVNLSSTEGISSKLDSTPATNGARIKELKAAIADGSYSTDSNDIAQKIIQNEQELGVL